MFKKLFEANFTKLYTWMTILLHSLCYYVCFFFACYFTIRRGSSENMQLPIRHSLCVPPTVCFHKQRGFLTSPYPDKQRHGLSKIIPDGVSYKKTAFSVHSKTWCHFLCSSVTARFLFLNISPHHFTEFHVRGRHIHNIPFQADFIKGVAKCKTQESVI